MVFADSLGLFTVEAGAPDCLVEYVMNQVPKLISHPTIPENLSAASGAPLGEVTSGLAWGSGPQVVLDDIPHSPDQIRYGGFSESRPSQFRIQRKFVEQLCNCPCDDALLGLGTSLLHEYAHQLYFSARGHEPGGVEAGDDFERRTYTEDTILDALAQFYGGCVR